MYRSWMSLALSVTLGLPIVAAAKGDNRQPQNMGQLGEVDLYIKDALNNARLLFQVSDPAQGGQVDPALAREQVTNIDRALSNIDKHMNQIRSQPRSFDLLKIDLVSRDVEQARSQLMSLRSSITGRGTSFHDGSMELARSLERADDDFGQLAQSVGLARIDQIRVTVKQPVRGTDFDQQNNVDKFDVTSPNVRGGGIDHMNHESERQIPDPGSTSPEHGAYPRY